MSDAVVIALATGLFTATPIVVGQILTFLATRKATVKAAETVASHVVTVAQKVEEVASVALGQKGDLKEIKELVNGNHTAQVEEIKQLRADLAASLQREKKEHE